MWWSDKGLPFERPNFPFPNMSYEVSHSPYNLLDPDYRLDSRSHAQVISGVLPPADLTMSVVCAKGPLNATGSYIGGNNSSSSRRLAQFCFTDSGVVVTLILQVQTGTITSESSRKGDYKRLLCLGGPLRSVVERLIMCLPCRTQPMPRLNLLWPSCTACWPPVVSGL